MLNMSDVNRDNQSDVEGFNRVGIPLPHFPSFDAAPVYTGTVAYRSAPDFGVAISLTYFEKTIGTNYQSSEEILSLTRTVESTDVMVGFAYYPSWRPYFMEWYADVRMGVTFARARAEAYGAQFVKIGGEPTAQVSIDTKGKYAKSKLTVVLGLGASMNITGPLILKADVGYKFAQLGQIDGEVSRLGVTRTETTNPEFDFSAVTVSAGVGIEF